MAEKDITEKILESYNDVFSDIVNVLLFDGKQVLSPDELEDQTPDPSTKQTAKYGKLNGMLPSVGKTAMSESPASGLKTRRSLTLICRSASWVTMVPNTAHSCWQTNPPPIVIRW